MKAEEILPPPSQEKEEMVDVKILPPSSQEEIIDVEFLPPPSQEKEETVDVKILPPSSSQEEDEIIDVEFLPPSSQEETVDIEEEDQELDEATLAAIDELVGQPSPLVPESVLPHRKAFFKHLVLLNKENGIELNEAPQISCIDIDLHRLYIAVRRRGGFKQVVKDKIWSDLCLEANPYMSRNSAAAYQLRLNYQRYLLRLECDETETDYDEMQKFVDGLRTREKKEPGEKKERKRRVKNEKVDEVAAAPVLTRPSPINIDPSSQVKQEFQFQPMLALKPVLLDEFDSFAAEDCLKLFDQEETKFEATDYESSSYFPDIDFPMLFDDESLMQSFNHDTQATLADPTFATQYEPLMPPMFEDDLNLAAESNDSSDKSKSGGSKKSSGVSRKRKRLSEKEFSSEEEESLLKDMSKRFKARRCELKFSQKDVAESISGCLNTDMSQTTVSRFETIKLSSRNMETVKQTLDDWLAKLDESIENGQTATDFLKETKQMARQQQS